MKIELTPKNGFAEDPERNSRSLKARLPSLATDALRLTHSLPAATANMTAFVERLLRTMKNAVTLTPANGRVVAECARIIGCAESEFLNRWLDHSLSAYFVEQSNSPPKPDSEGAARCMEQFEFKNRDEANRVSDWIYHLAKKEAKELGIQNLNIKTEIIECELEPMPFRIKFTEQEQRFSQMP